MEKNESQPPTFTVTGTALCTEFAFPERYIKGQTRAVVMTDVSQDKNLVEAIRGAKDEDVALWHIN